MALQHIKRYVYQLSEGAVMDDLLQLHLPRAHRQPVQCCNPCWAIPLQQELPWMASMASLCVWTRMACSMPTGGDHHVQMSSVWGLWIIIGGAMAAAVVGGVGEYAWKRYRKHEDVDHMRHRLSMFLSISERRNRSRLQAAEAAVAEEGGAQPGAHRLTPFMHGPKGGGVAWAHRASDIGCRFHMPRMHEPGLHPRHVAYLR